MHWNGNTWTITPTPNSNPPSADHLKKIAAISSNDVWAVGGPGSSNVLHWNGTSWTQVPVSIAAGRDGAAPVVALEDIASVTSNDVWLVGSRGTAGGATTTLTMHWNGAEWTQIPSPNVPNPSGGFYSQSLNAVVALASNNVWAVGSYLIGSTPHTLVQRWNGTQWSIVPSPDGPSNNGVLYGISAANPNDVWAVGEFDKASLSSPGKALTLHWDGAAWSAVVPPNPSPTGVTSLKSVAARGPNDFYAVGEFQTRNGGLEPYVIHWNGSLWTQVFSQTFPGNGTGGNQLHDAGRDANGGLWTVGTKEAAAGGTNLTLVEKTNFAPAAPAMTGAVSRKTHGAAGIFDIALPATGAAGIEPRLPTNGEYEIVFTFNNPVASVDNASVTAGTAIIASRTVGPNMNQVTVRLTGVTDLQSLVVSLNGVNDQNGATLASASARMDVVVGDTNESRAVNSADIAQTKSRAGNAVTASTFRSDVNVSGTLSSADVSAVKSRAGGGL